MPKALLLFFPALLLATLLFLAAPGCGGQQESRPMLTQTQAGLTATLALIPEQPKAMEPARIVLTLTSDQGRPVDNASVAFDLTMPEMAMPENKPQAEALDGGRYQAEALFTMSGKWRLQVRVDQAEGQSHGPMDFTFGFTVQ